MGAGVAVVDTFMTQVHLYLERLELVGQAGAGLCAHLFVCPLLQAVEFLVDVHDCGRQSAEEARVEGMSREWEAGRRWVVRASAGPCAGVRIACAPKDRAGMGVAISLQRNEGEWARERVFGRREMKGRDKRRTGSGWV